MGGGGGVTLAVMLAPYVVLFALPLVRSSAVWVVLCESEGGGGGGGVGTGSIVPPHREGSKSSF